MTHEKTFHSGSQVMQLELFQRLVGQLRAKGVQYKDLYSSWSTPVDWAYWERGRRLQNSQNLQDALQRFPLWKKVRVQPSRSGITSEQSVLAGPKQRVRGRGKNDERSEKRREGLAASDTGFAFEAEEFACIHAPAAQPPLSRMSRHSHLHSHDWFGGVRCCWTETAPPTFSVPRQGSN
jgi:hypothetical protein